MAIEDRRERERAERRRLIISTARRLAEAEGWEAVTTRRLSTEIEYSQPVLYKHFASMDHIVEALAYDGFGELAVALRAARREAGSAVDALTRIAHAYVDFARANPALYVAMFTRATKLRFAAEDDSSPLTEAFIEVREGVSAVAGGADVDTLTEVFWAALHGVTTLARDGRLRPGYDSDRVDLLAARFAAAT
ncbi:TetR family transcriptional regulator [Mycolicibacterium madagascariense]|uniref:TetR family transcriptional regulator n=1 Tax=Mycolicibacterium madagascariense TaxID=212765 RepID=A0A7I7X9D3_9MYCO|nr:TetR/AcrR family transcriptional regulator [Mycolicibacterium madagascariense]MCV7015066.1 TetR/AcrR family transcriptional regulator [Mycolicibacterium madagascariense]BBZ25940.1 TetR family transcriptional regulator [Mycolicibacterium madagascariense]